MRKHLVFFLLSAVSITVLTAACATSIKSQSASDATLAADEEHPDEEGVVYGPEAGLAELMPDAASESDAIDLIDIDQLLVLAYAAAGDSMFTAADSILRRVSAFLMRNSVEAITGVAAGEDEDLPIQEYVAKILSFYAEHMPPSYSVPEEVSVLIFKQHLLESLLDSLNVSERDSIYLHRLSAKRGVVYEVPMVWNDRVRRALMFYMRTRNGVFDRWLHRAGYYLPMTTQMFADSGLPRDLAYLPIIESGFNPYAYSRAHAAGIWQFIPSTGRVYGMRQNYWIDERRDPIKSTEGAIKYLRKLYNDFGDWHTALASYNCGEGGMSRAIRRANGNNNYWELQLPKETMNYIPLFLGAVLITRNPDVFDFALQDSVIFDPDTVMINDCIEMKTIAEGIGISLDTLTMLNPHILHWATPPDMPNVRIYLPKGYAGKFRDFYAELPDEKKTKYHRYKVQSGDNIQSIARKFKVSAETIRKANNMNDNAVAAGRYLIIPVPVNVTLPADLVRHLNATDRRQQREIAKLRAATSGPPLGSAPGRGPAMAVSAPTQASSVALDKKQAPKAATGGRRISYKVRAGETLSTIATTFGVSVSDLMSWNYLASPRSLKAEQTLIIYQNDRAAATPSAQRVSGSSTEHTGKHLVKQGETLYGISQMVGVSVSELARINGLNPGRPMIFPGDVLVYTPDTDAAAITTNQRTNSQPIIQASATAQPTTTSPSEPRPSSGQITIYTVKRGDNLWRISLIHGVTVEAIRAENNLTPESAIKPGDILRITR